MGFLDADFGLGFRQRVEMGAAARSPRAQAKLPPTDLPIKAMGIPVYRSTAIDEGVFFYGHDVWPDGTMGRKVVFVGPITYWRLQHPGREPLLSRHCRGLRELERDRRRYPRPVEAT